MLTQLRNNLSHRKENVKDSHHMAISVEPSVFSPFAEENEAMHSQGSGSHNRRVRERVPSQRRQQMLKRPSREKDKQRQVIKKQESITLEQEDVIKILQESDSMIKASSIIEGINLLKAMKDPMIKIGDNRLRCIITWNLAVAYYQSGFLEEAFDEFVEVVGMLRTLREHVKGDRQCDMKGTIVERSLLYMGLQGRVQLQICILFSQLGSHEKAMGHASRSCKLHYEMVYEMLGYLSSGYGKVKQEERLNEENNLLVLEYLDRLVGELAREFKMEERVGRVKEGLGRVRNGFVQKRADMEMLFSCKEKPITQNATIANSPLQPSLKPSIQQESTPASAMQWIFVSKILDRIQLKTMTIQQLTVSASSQSNEKIIQLIAYLTISFYCYSTEVRFVEKHKPSLSLYGAEQDDIMQSQHWLSRSLEIAYSFLPVNAPILNQILTVYDRFHSLDKQTIHEDKQVSGCYKVLRSLAKPKSTYSSKNNLNSAPIMIRVQAPNVKIQIAQSTTTNGKRTYRSAQKIFQDQQQSDEQHHQKSIQQPATIDIETFTRNNKIKGLSTRIKILEFNDTIKQNNKQYHLTNHKNVSHKTIGQLSSLQTDREKKQRIARIYHSTNTSKVNNLRNLTQEGKKQALTARRIEADSQTQLDGRAVISEDLLYRPHSYDNRNAYMKDFVGQKAKQKKYSTLGSTFSVTTTTKKRRSLSQNGRSNKEKLEKLVYNGSIKLDGLKLTGKKLHETFELDNSLFQKLSQAHNTNNQSILSGNMMKGNIFINNNINLYISQPDKQVSKSAREQTTKRTGKHDVEIGKRQRFLTKRRLSLMHVDGDQQGNTLSLL